MKIRRHLGYFLLFTLWSKGFFAQSFDDSEKGLIDIIDKEYIKASLKYSSKDSGLFQDIQQVMVGIKVDLSFTEPEKLRFYGYLNDFVRDINTNLYASKKIDDRDYRRILRLMPTAFYYIHEDRLEQFLLQNYRDALRVAPFLSEEDATKKALIKIGMDYPLVFYAAIEEIASFKYFNSIFIHLAAYDPVSFVQQLDKNSFLFDIATSSSNPIVKKVVDIKKRLGNSSILFNFLNEVIRNSFNDTHELGLEQNKEYLTKKIIEASLTREAYGHKSAINFIPTITKWLLEDFLEGKETVFSEYNQNEIFVILVMNHSNLEYNDFVSIIDYMGKNDYNQVTLETLRMLPKEKYNGFIKKMEKAELLIKLSEIMDTEAATAFLTDEKYLDLEKLPMQNADWFSTSYNHEKDQKERQLVKTKSVASTFQINKSQLSLLSWARNLNKVDSNIISILKSPIGSRFIDYLARYQPQILANNREKLKSQIEFSSIIDKLAYHSPLTIKKYLGSANNEIALQVFSANNPQSGIIKEIFSKYKFNTKAYALLHKIVHKEISIDRAHNLGNSEVEYLKSLMSITIQKNPIGIHSVEEEQNQVSLKYIREINDNPSSSHPNLLVIRDFSGPEIYSMMVLGKEEIFQFAFDHFYRFFNSNLNEQNLMEFLPRVNKYKYREFCVLLANFGRFTELLNKNTSEAQRQDFLREFMHIDFAEVKCIEQAAVICEFINNCDNEEVQRILQKEILREYQEADARKDQLALAVYSLLASNIGHRAIENPDWFASMESKYNKYTLSYIDVDDIKNKQNKIIEVSYFYNDADGVASFNSYINTFRNMPKWYLQDLGSYYFISSLDGNDYEIYANKPQFEQAGQASIKEYLVLNKIEPSIIVHRGHSYHSQKTIDQMVGSPRFIFMGSCGGYYKISELLARSPNAQIMSTKQVGTMSINDPMLRSIHEIFRSNENIDWPKFWSQQEARLGGLKDFKMYVPPHKNNGALFVNAFFKVVGL